MKRKCLLTFLSTFTLLLTGCTNVRHDISEYVLELDYKDNYRILQLTDIHISDKDNTKLHYDFMDLTINEAHPDLIVLTGDVFTLISKSNAKEFIDYMDGHNIKWTLTWGNHDEQCYFSIDWLTGYLNNYGSNLVFKDIQDDDVTGNANFAINLMKDNKVFEQLIIMDSNRYHYGLDYNGYDYFKQNQIDWYSRLVDETTRNNDNQVVPSLMFYHIPLPEVNDAWAAAEADPSKNINGGVKNEAPCNPKFNSGFFDVIKAKGSTKGMYFGHDHYNNFIVEYEGVHFGYGVKSTDRIYSDSNMLGGRVITIDNNHNINYEDYYHTYEEVM